MFAARYGGDGSGGLVLVCQLEDKESRCDEVLEAPSNSEDVMRMCSWQCNGMAVPWQPAFQCGSQCYVVCARTRMLQASYVLQILLGDRQHAVMCCEGFDM
jgi:hypothetical protein